MQAFEDLLVVQAHDTTMDQLRHRHTNMAERAQLSAVQAQLAALEREAGSTQAERDEISRTERRLEDEVALVNDKAKQADQLLYSGRVNVPRELTALQEEIEALGRRTRQLEDQELELMERAEPIDERLVGFAQRRSAFDEQAIALLAQIAEAESEIEAELATESAQRSAAAASVPAELLHEYEALRGALGGIGVARLNGNRCEGCHLTLSAVDVDRIRREPDDAIAHCTECSRILVR